MMTDETPQVPDDWGGNITAHETEDVEGIVSPAKRSAGGDDSTFEAGPLRWFVDRVTTNDRLLGRLRELPLR